MTREVRIDPSTVLGTVLKTSKDRRRTDSGYSLVEAMFVVALLGVLSTIAMAQIASGRPGRIADNGMRVVLSQMNQAREMAITQRRNIRLTFLGANYVRLTREEAPGTTLTVLSTVTMEEGMELVVFESNGDTPDAFGFDAPTTFKAATTVATEVKFTPDGRFVNEAGALVNGTVYVGLPGQPASGRAVTIMGSTGRIRGYRREGSRWQAV